MLFILRPCYIFATEFSVVQFQSVLPLVPQFFRPTTYTTMLFSVYYHNLYSIYQAWNRQEVYCERRDNTPYYL